MYKDMKILYLHGIGSGANSRTPRELRKYLPDFEIIAPQLPANPKEAVKFIRDNYALEDDIALVVGTSLGGFYALTLPMVKKLIINPAMFADIDVSKSLGMGVQNFLSKREDGASTYIIDEEFIRELEVIRKRIYETDILRPDRIEHNLINETYGLFGINDKVVSHYNDFCELFLPEHAYTFQGEHRLSVDEIRDELVPIIKRILDEPPIPYFFLMSEME